MSHSSPRPITWTPDKVRQFWNGVEHCHLSEKAFAKNAGDALIEIIRPYLPSGGRVIDFGAGSGELSQKLIEAGFYVAALEPSSERQQSLLARIGAHKNWLGFLDGQPLAAFDVVLLVEVLEHVSPNDAPLLLKRAISYLRPGGFLVITTPNSEDIRAAEAYCPDCNQLFHPWQHLQSVTYTSLLDLTSRYGVDKTYLLLADFSADKEIVEELKWRHQEAEARNLRDLTTIRRLCDVHVQLSQQQQDLIELEKQFVPPSIEVAQSLKTDREKIFSLFASLDRLPLTKRLWAKLRLARNVKPILHLFLESHNELSQALANTAQVRETIKQSLAAVRSRVSVSLTHLEDAQQFVAGHTQSGEQDDQKSAVAPATPAPIVDSRVGKETTIVFVGQKR